MGLANFAMKQIFPAADKLNSRPRKCLGFKTPNEVFEELTSVNVRNLMGYALIA
jgi:IS30 family transposase